MLTHDDTHAPKQAQWWRDTNSHKSIPLVSRQRALEAEEKPAAVGGKHGCKQCRMNSFANVLWGRKCNQAFCQASKHKHNKMPAQFVVNATHKLISLRCCCCCSWNIIIHVHGYPTQTRAGLDDAQVGFDHISGIYCLDVTASTRCKRCHVQTGNTSHTAPNSRTIVATERSHFVPNVPVLTPNASNTAAWSLTLHHKFWHCT